MIKRMLALIFIVAMLVWTGAAWPQAGQIRPQDLSPVSTNVWNLVGQTKIGTGTPTHATTAGSFFVSGPLEADGVSWLDGGAVLGGVLSLMTYATGSLPTGVPAGSIAWDTSTGELKRYDGMAWAAVAGGIGGSGTSGYVPRFTGTATIGAGTIRDDGAGHVGIGGAPGSDPLAVTGQVSATTFSGSGSGLTAIPAAALAAGGTFPAISGANLTAIPTSALTGTISGSSITGGTFGPVNGSALTNLSGSAVSGGTFGAINGSALTALNGTNIATGTVGVGVGGTGLTSYAVGDIPYASGSSTLSKLADVATGSVLVSGGVTTAPAWSSTPTVTSLTDTTHTTSADFQWTGGRVTYVPLAGTLSTYITNATAGDTLVLGSGTYTFGSSQTINKALTFIGQGMDRTILLCNGAVTNWSVTASNVTFRDLTLQNSSSGSTMVVDGTAGTILTGIRFNNVKLEETNATTNVVNIQTIDAIVEARNCQFVQTGASSATTFYNVRVQANSTAEGAVTATFTNCTSVINAIDSAAVNGLYVFDNGTTNPLNAVWRGSYVESNNTGTGGSNGILTFGGDSSLFAEDGYITARTADISNGVGNAWVRSTTLAENTTVGTVFGQGTSRVANSAPYVSVAAPTYKNDLYVANTSTVGSELTTNGDMEAAISTLGATNANTAATFAQSSTQVHAGSFSGALTATSTAAAFRQMGSITELVAGKTYVASVWVYNPSTGGAATNVQLYGVYSSANISPDVTTTTLKDVWTQLSIIFTIPKGATANTYLRIIMNGNAISSVTYWDDFSVKQVTDGDVYANDAVLTGTLGVTGAITGASFASTGAVSGTTITGTGIISGSGLRATGLLSAANLATDGSGNVILGSASSGRAPGAVKVIAASNSLSTTGADYICTGTDDQTFINTAITAMATNGGTIVLLDGTFTFANGAAATKNVVMGNNIRIVGQGPSSTFIKRGGNPSTLANGALFYNSGASTNIGFENLTMDGVKATYTNGNNQGIVSASGISNLVLRNVEMTGFVGDAFYANAGSLTFGEVDHCYIHDNTGMGFDINNGGFYRCQFTNNYFNANNRHLSAGSSGSQGTVIDGNEFRAHIATADLYLNTPNSYKIVNNYFNGGTAGSAAVYMSGGQDGNLIGWNRIESPVAGGILITASGGHNIVTGNYISAAVGSAIYVDGTGGAANDDDLVADNQIITPTGHGIEVLNVSNSVFRDNKIYNGGGSGANDGIRIYGNSDNNVVSGNSIFDTAGTGYAINISVSTDDVNVLQGNRYSGTGASAINDAGTGTRWENQWDGFSLVTRAAQTSVKRLVAGLGASALAAGNFSQSGFGAGAVITVATGSTDAAGTVIITTSVSDTPTANPTVTLTFVDGAYVNNAGSNQAPFSTANYNSSSTGPVAQITTDSTTTTSVFRYNGTPTATSALTYKVTWHNWGSR